MFSTAVVRACPGAVVALDTEIVNQLLATGRSLTQLHLRKTDRCEYEVVGASGARLIIDPGGRAWHSVVRRLGIAADVAVYVDYDEGEDTDGTTVSFATLCARDEDDPDEAGLAEEFARRWLSDHLPGFLT